MTNTFLAGVFPFYRWEEPITCEWNVIASNLYETGKPGNTMLIFLSGNSMQSQPTYQSHDLTEPGSGRPSCQNKKPETCVLLSAGHTHARHHSRLLGHGDATHMWRDNPPRGRSENVPHLLDKHMEPFSHPFAENHLAGRIAGLTPRVSHQKW